MVERNTASGWFDLFRRLLLWSLFYGMPGTALQAQAFQKIYTTTTSLYALPQQAVQRPDGNYLATYVTANDNGQFHLSCLDPFGSILWTTRFEYLNPTDWIPTTFDMLHCATSDNGCLMMMVYRRYADSRTFKRLIAKTDAGGQLQWVKEYQVPGNCITQREVMVPYPGGIIIALENCVVNATNSFFAALVPPYMANLTNEGLVLWEKNIDFRGQILDGVYQKEGAKVLFSIGQDSSSNGQIQNRISALGLDGSFEAGVALENAEALSTFPGADSSLFFCGGDAQNRTLLLGNIKAGQVLWAKRILNDGFAAGIPQCARLFPAGPDSMAIAIIWENAIALLQFDRKGHLGQSRSYTYPYRISCNTPIVQNRNGGFNWIINDGFQKEIIFAATSPNFLLPNCHAQQACSFRLVDAQLDYRRRPPISLKTTGLLSPGTLKQYSATLTQKDYCAPQPPPPDPSIYTEDTVRCMDERFFFRRNPAMTGLSHWFFEKGNPPDWLLPSTPGIQFPGVGQFTITHVLTQLGCPDTGRLSVTLLPPPVVRLPADTFICQGAVEKLVIKATGEKAWHYQWTDLDTNRTRTIVAPGLYILTAADEEACVGKDSIVVGARAAPELFLTGDTLICREELGKIVAYTRGTLTGFNWSNGKEQYALEISQEGWYRAIAKNGTCSVSDSLFVSVEDCPLCHVYLPNVFDPASTAENGLFGAHSNCNLVNFKLQVFDRWGNLAFDSTDPDNGWDGNVRGKQAQPGVYIYLLNGKTDNGKNRTSFEKKGTVLLIR